MLNKLLNIVFPESCPICKNRSSDHKIAPFCLECWETIIPYAGPACRKCGAPLVSEQSSICGECLDDEPAFEFARSFGLYEGALKKAIGHMKYYGIKRLSKPLSDIIISSKLPQVDLIIPVPLHLTRLRQREFNQSALLANNMAKGLGILLLLNCLVKERDTMAQVGLSSKERVKNLKNAFAVRKPELIRGKRLILVDDVVTTGATIRECSRVLKKAGAESINVLTLAHAAWD